MPLIPRLAAVALLTTLVTGCTGGEEPAVVVFYGGSAVTANAACDNPAPTYVTLFEEFEVNQESGSAR